MKTDSPLPNSNRVSGCVERLVRPLPEYTYVDGEGPECPFCGTVWTADDPMYYDESGFDDECSECGNHIRIEPIVSVSWKTMPIRWANDQAHTQKGRERGPDNTQD